MKIYYKYNGFIRSSELNLLENMEGDFRETFILLGEFGEEFYDLFGVVLVEKSWNNSNMSFNISGFNKTGNGDLGYYEGETLQVLYSIFKESWDYIQTEEEALEQLEISVERLEIEVVPNPDKSNDKDDLYTYLNSDERVIKSCSRVKVKVPQRIGCIPTNVTFSKEYDTIKPYVITVSRNGGPFITFDLNSPDLDEYLYFRTMKGSISGDGLAFIDGRENLYDYIVRGVINEPIFGISTEGYININDSRVYLENEKIIYNNTIIEAPYIIQEETNWLTFIPTEGVHPDSDKFYKLYGNKENNQITVYSCAYLTKDWNDLEYIPTKYLI